MASVAGTSFSLAAASFSSKQAQGATRFSNVPLVSVPANRRGFQSRRFSVSCAAKPETVDKVSAIVKKQLALPEDTSVTGESKFASLGADSLDTIYWRFPSFSSMINLLVLWVEIVMGLEEEFGISVEEESAQTIATVQDAADLIEKLLETK